VIRYPWYCWCLERGCTSGLRSQVWVATRCVSAYVRFYSTSGGLNLILPGMGVISEVINDVLAHAGLRYKSIAFSEYAIAVFGLPWWAHHKFDRRNSCTRQCFSL